MAVPSTSARCFSLIARFAARQHGVVHWAQLRAAGISAGQIHRCVLDGRLKELHRGVYLVGAIAPPLAIEQAALFACGPAAVLSHRTSAAYWKLILSPPDLPWVTIPRSKRIARPNIHVHRADIAQRDIRTRKSLRISSPPRAVLECAALIDDAYLLESLAAEASYRGLASESELRHQCERNQNRTGVPALRAVLDLEGGPQRTRSKGERAFLRFLRAERFTDFEANAKVAGWEVDFLWRNLHFAVELDSWDGHRSRQAFEKDRLKWAELQARGIQVMPVTGRRFRDDRVGVAQRLRAALAGRSRQRVEG